MALFVDERGYTSVFVSVALMASVALVLCVASVEWTVSRGADVQEVADAAALAGANVVARYSTIAQVVDAMVLSMGLAGMAVLGSGLVLAAVPGAQTASAEAIDLGCGMLRSRRAFAKSAHEGLREVERVLPAVCVVNARACVAANSTDGLSYEGIVMPFPPQSLSDLAPLEAEVTEQGTADAAERLRELTRSAEQAKRRADDACERGWRADCVDDPRCMRSRAASLAGLSGSDNPDAPSASAWGFGMAISRARAYYARRIEREAPASDDIESRVDSIARSAWYGYALSEVRAAYCLTREDGGVDLRVPHLARNSEEVRDTRLYSDAVWPCTEEPDGRTLHATLSCPGARGPADGMASVSQIDDGSVLRCDACAFDVRDLGAVAGISTSADNGFEHYWQKVVEAASDYAEAKDEQAQAERAMRQAAEEGKGAFQAALEQLKVPRPRICPPGAWGCVSVVRRGGGAAAPTELVRGLMSSSSLPAGLAVSAATLAPDDATKGSGVLDRFFDGLASEGQGGLGGALGGVTRLWGRLLSSYGDSFEGVGSAVGDYLGGMDQATGGGLGAWLSESVSSAMGALGLQPADMRLRKPVLAGTADVLGMAGLDSDREVRRIARHAVHVWSSLDMARRLGVPVWRELDGRSLPLAEVPLPGGDGAIPLSLDLGELGDAA